jgi:hypothetical protein
VPLFAEGALKITDDDEPCLRRCGALNARDVGLCQARIDFGRVCGLGACDGDLSALLFSRLTGEKQEQKDESESGRWHCRIGFGARGLAGRCNLQ